MAIVIGNEGNLLGIYGQMAAQIGQGQRLRDEQKLDLERAQVQQRQQQIDNAFQTQMANIFSDAQARQSAIQQRRDATQLANDRAQMQEQGRMDRQELRFDHDIEKITAQAQANGMKLDQQSQQIMDELNQYDSQIDQAVEKRIITSDEAQQYKWKRRQLPRYQRAPSFVPNNYDAQKFLDENTVDGPDGQKYHIDPKTGKPTLIGEESVKLQAERDKHELAMKSKQDQMEMNRQQKILDMQGKWLENQFKAGESYADRKETEHLSKQVPGKETAFDRESAIREGMSQYARFVPMPSFSSGMNSMPQMATPPAPSQPIQEQPVGQRQVPPPPPQESFTPIVDASTKSAQSPPAHPAPPPKAPSILDGLSDVARPVAEEVIKTTGLQSRKLIDAIKRETEDDFLMKRPNPGKEFKDSIVEAHRKIAEVQAKYPNGIPWMSLRANEVKKLTEYFRLLTPYLEKKNAIVP